MNNAILFVIGVLMLVAGVYSLITGDAMGLAGGYMHTNRAVRFNGNPVEYILVVGLQIILGIWLIYSAWKKAKK